MPELCTHEQCTGCGACAQVCPRGCIQMVSNGNGFLYPEIDQDTCVECGICGKRCPIQNRETGKSIKKAYAACHMMDVVRRYSSSGGVFTAIAETVIDVGGVVFGVRLNEHMKAVHDCAETKEQLRAFRGSKYVQSDLNDSFQKVRDFLDEGRLVLFTGTPCQIAGLLTSLPRKYDNLVCQDIICHGVPAPIAWRCYLEELENQYEAKAHEAYFRNKSSGWSNYSMRIKFENGKVFSEEKKHNIYMSAFLGDYCLRPSCYRCAFKQEDRLADLTLADFWGIDRVMPEMNDGGGTSLVLVHSERGEKLLKQSEKNLYLKPADWKNALLYNSAMVCSAVCPGNRERFLKALKKMSFSQAVEKYCKPTLREYAMERFLQLRYLPNQAVMKFLGVDRYEKLKKLLKRK